MLVDLGWKGLSGTVRSVQLTLLKTDQLVDCGLFGLRRGIHTQLTERRTQVEEGQP
jgi:hypothetical protein